MLLFKSGGRLTRRGKKNIGRLALQRSKLAIERLSRFRFFSASDYAAMHRDIGAYEPAKHFVVHGADENRRAAKQVHIARMLGELAGKASVRQTSTEAASAPLTVGIYVSSLSNVFMREIAAALGDLLRTAGHTVNEHDENADIEARPKHCIYVAPHEFFVLGRGPQWVRDDVLADACMYCTEQVQTKWFWESLHIVLMARSVIDMSAPLAAAFGEVMPAACVFPSVGRTRPPIDPAALAHPLLSGQRWWMDAAPHGDPSARPLDLCFLGTVSPHRAFFFARNAERLSRFESFIYLRTRNAAEPMNASTGEEALIDVAQHVARHSRVLLNVHRDEFPYFEWHRLVYQGMANGCVVVSEPCFANPEFQPGIHYLAEEPHRLTGLLEWVLNDRDGKEKAGIVARSAEAAARDAASEAARARMLIDVLTV